jgi:hypothetical protein
MNDLVRNTHPASPQLLYESSATWLYRHGPKLRVKGGTWPRRDPPFNLENREPKLLSLAFVCVRAPGTGQEGFLLLIRMLIGDWGANAAKPGL